MSLDSRGPTLLGIKVDVPSIRRCQGSILIQLSSETGILKMGAALVALHSWPQLATPVPRFALPQGASTFSFITLCHW
jgi:hypothetical protein